MKKNNDYRDEVFEYLDRMPACIKPLSELCIPENRTKFLEVVIQYIQQGTKNGYVTELNLARDKIRKFDIILLKIIANIVDGESLIINRGEYISLK